MWLEYFDYICKSGIKTIFAHNLGKFAGVERDSLSFNEIKELFLDKVLHKILPNRFYKSFSNLSIQIKPSSITIRKSNNKVLVNNNYIPLNIK